MALTDPVPAIRDLSPHERSTSTVQDMLASLEESRASLVAEADQHESASSHLRAAQSLTERAIDGLKTALAADAEMVTPQKAPYR